MKISHAFLLIFFFAAMKSTWQYSPCPSLHPHPSFLWQTSSYFTRNNTKFQYYLSRSVSYLIQEALIVPLSIVYYVCLPLLTVNFLEVSLSPILLIQSWHFQSIFSILIGLIYVIQAQS